jgi:hypothetical protein
MSKIGESMDETTKNFWEAWALPVDPPRPIFYRLYYDDQGYLLYYSMEDIPGNYIEIDQATYAALSPRVRVIDGKLHHIKTNSTRKLVPDKLGQACDPRDIAVISDSRSAKYWRMKETYETD